MAERLTAWGYISFVVDSFASRGIKESCDRLRLMPSRQADALGALLYLSKLDFVDPKRLQLSGLRRAAWSLSS